MKIKYEMVRSTTKPELIDNTSSPTTVYVRKDVSKDGDWYEYKEAKLSLDEYEAYESECNSILNQRMTEDNALIMESISDLYMQLADVQENQLVLMEALTEIGG